MNASDTLLPVIGQGYVRADGRKGIRNTVLVVYLVECAHHVAGEIAHVFGGNTVQLIGFRGCYPNDHAERLMHALCTHPNVGGVVLVSLGCESFNRDRLYHAVHESGRPVSLIVIQHESGTAAAVAKGQQAVRAIQKELVHSPRASLYLQDLVVGTVCGGSDATSGITANPAVGRFFDRFVALGGTGIFEETGELLGCEDVLAARGATPEIGQAAADAVRKAGRYYAMMGLGSFAPGNADGGLTTIEEKSLGAYAKSGSCRIAGLLLPGQCPAAPGLWLLDVVPDGDPLFGFPNISDVVEIIEMAACGAHMALYTTGRGSVAGSAIAPTIKICGNPDTYARMADDMDVNAGAVLTGTATLNDVAEDIMRAVAAVAGGTPSRSERLGHQEFDLPYKRFAINDGFNSGRICG